jgi:hypothetical protein
MYTYANHAYIHIHINILRPRFRCFSCPWHRKGRHSRRDFGSCLHRPTCVPRNAGRRNYGCVWSECSGQVRLCVCMYVCVCVCMHMHMYMELMLRAGEAICMHACVCIHIWMIITSVWSQS